jgi:SLT domain-containing protein
MAQMAQDQQIQAKRALDAINRYTTGALGTNDQILKRALDASRGSMHAYFQELIKEMGVAQAAMANADQQNQANAPGAGTGKGTTPIASKDHEKMMIQALEYAGVQPNTANLNALNTIITNESGWNPNAINLTDSNAKAGHPSQGLMQTIPGTFNAYRSPSLSSSITDPLANMVAGINYAMHTYGSLLNVPGVVSTGQGHPYIGYATGVLATSPTRALIGEAGPEAVLPLNNQGVDFLLNLAKQLNSDGWSARNSNRYASKLEPTISTTHVDSSTNFTGPVTVQAQDPNAMANALKNKARMAALTRPDLTTGVLT